jgi:tetratricopeptide (TPR) repeat protein
MREELDRASKIRRNASGAAALALALAAMGLVAAQAQSPTLAHDGRAATEDARLSPDERNVDESALRYYASNGQAARKEAELRRLRSLYPHWTPPDTIDERPGGNGEDEDDLWDLYASDKLDALRTAIEQRRASEPGWEPSADLRAKYRKKLFRGQIAALANDGRYGDIVQWLKASGARLEGVDVDVLWTIAEAYQKSRLNAQALDVYKSILGSNGDRALRLATVQKSMGLLRMDEVEQLLAMANKGADGQGEFAGLATDIARARISAFLHDERLQEVEAADIKQFGEYARTATDPNQPALLAWYYYKLRAYSTALDWFKFALEHGGDAMVAHGLAHTLRFLGMKREAEEVAYAWREPLVNNSILFIDILETDLTKPVPPYIEPARLARYGEVAASTASGEGAQALAWYAYNSCQFNVALEWFERAVAWHPKDATVYGYALTLRRLKKRRQEAELINRYDGLFPKLVELLFPDGQNHPPTPCEQNIRAQQAVARAGVWAPNAAQAAVRDPGRQYAWGRVAGPGQGASGLATMPNISRTEFPIRVMAENPLRFAPAGQPVLINAPVGDNAPAESGGFSRQQSLAALPLVARRVPGVGPMPYERYGFGLLPGYNGVIIASSPTAAEQLAPAGTLWALERRNDLEPSGIGAPSSRPLTAPVATPRVETQAPTGPAQGFAPQQTIYPMGNG